MLRTYPYGSGEFYTGSFAYTSSFAQSAELLDYVITASNALSVRNPTPGPPADVNICLITYNQYLNLLANPDNYEQCTF